MASPILIVTPQADFGSYLCKGLDSARFVAFSTSDFSESIHYVRKNNCSFVLLDTELEDVELSVMDIGFALRQLKPDIQFILVVTAGQNVDTASLNPAATLIKPVSPTDVESLLERLSAPVVISKPAAVSTVKEMTGVERTLAETSRLTWLKDVSKAAQHLTRLTLESSAQAALITRQNELWAYAGQLSRDAALELTASIQRYWDAEGESDLLRFVRLQATEAQHMLYARKLSENLILALVFDAETPFSTIRSQAGKLVKNLSDSSFIESGKSPAPAAVAEQAAPVLPPVFSGADGRDEDEDLPPISELLGDVPPPIPPRVAPKIDLPWGQPSARISAQRLAVDEPPTTPPHSLKAEMPLPNQFSRESSPPVRREMLKRPLPAMDETFSSPVSTSEVDVQIETGKIEIPDELQVTRKQEVRNKDPESIIETRPQTVAESMTEVAHRILLEPASPSLVNLTYACLLLPRFDTHHLVGDFASRLNDWVPQTCIAFGWRLEHISVRPEYLQWVVRVPPSTAPGYIMRIIRQQTSDKIFSEFPRFTSDNPSGDFWAPGYLIMGSSQLHPQKLVRDFISQTRARQGLGYH